MKSHSTERAFIVIFASFIALSGYFFTNINSSTYTQNDFTRALLTVILITIITTRLILFRKIFLNKNSIIIALPFLYMMIIGIIRANGLDFAGASTRWLFYLLVMIYFSQPTIHQHLPVFIMTTGGLLVLSGIIDIAMGRALHINEAVRIPGSVGSPIGFASALYCGALGLAWIGLDRRRMSLLIAAVGVCSLIFATGTRSIAVGASLTLFALWWISTRTLHLKTAITFSLATGAYFVLGGLLSNTDVGRRLQLLSAGSSDSSWMNREFILSTVFERLSPFDFFFGVGAGRFPSWFYEQTGVSNMAPHFEIVWLLLEGGLIGGVLYLLMLISVTMLALLREKNHNLSRCSAFFVVFLLWSQQTVLQFANPMFFYQTMTIVYASIGALLYTTTRSQDALNTNPTFRQSKI